MKMSRMEAMDKLDEVYEILYGLKNLCIILENSMISEIFTSMPIIMEVVIKRIIVLIIEVKDSLKE